MKSIHTSYSRRLGLMIALFLLFGFSQVNQSVAQSSLGTEFWVCFPSNYYGEGSRQLYITSSYNAVVNVTIANPAFATVVNIPAGTLSTVTVPLSVDITTNGVIENKGIHITSDNPVTVYGMSEQFATSDAYLALPVDALGTVYYIMSYTYNVMPSEMTIVATEDNTSVTITPTQSGGGFTAGVPGNVVLNQGQTFQLMGGDYTGSLIVADKHIGVFGSVQCVNIPTGVYACDFITEQLTPLKYAHIEEVSIYRLPEIACHLDVFIIPSRFVVGIISNKASAKYSHPSKPLGSIHVNLSALIIILSRWPL